MIASINRRSFAAILGAIGAVSATAASAVTTENPDAPIFGIIERLDGLNEEWAALDEEADRLRDQAKTKRDNIVMPIFTNEDWEAFDLTHVPEDLRGRLVGKPWSSSLVRRMARIDKKFGGDVRYATRLYQLMEIVEQHDADCDAYEAQIGLQAAIERSDNFGAHVGEVIATLENTPVHTIAGLRAKAEALRGIEGASGELVNIMVADLAAMEARS